MTTTEIKAELNRARDAEQAYRLARDKVNAYGQLLMCGKTARYDNDGGTHERRGNPVENAYCQLADYNTEADRLFREFTAARKRTEDLISSVPDPVQREVLTRRYIIGQRWEEIAESMNYSVRHITRLHGIALKNMSLNVHISL